jgi:transposase
LFRGEEYLMELLSFDVSKDELMVFDGIRSCALENKGAALRAELARHPGWAVAMEPTSTYHMELAVLAYSQGRAVYLVNPRDLKHYRESLSFRAKTDRIDAEVMHQYVRKHPEKLHPWAPLPPELVKLKDALRRWFQASQIVARMAQVWAKADTNVTEALDALDRLRQAAQEEAIATAKLIDAACYARNLSAPGVGPYSACALTFLLRSRPFKKADSLNAFVGIDLRVSDSGKKKGPRFITKRGDPMLRHAITCAGRGLLNSVYGRDVNLQLKAQNRAYAERIVMAGRKVLRTVFALDQSKTSFDRQKFAWKVDTKT